MKKQSLICLVTAIIMLSCTDSRQPSGMAGGVDPGNPVLNKVPENIPVHLEITKYYRNSSSEWCVAMRVFRDDGGNLPETGYDYKWYWDNAACNGTDQFVLWSHSTDSRTAYIDGVSDPTKPLSRFKFYVTTTFNPTLPITIGRDMRSFPITGCGTSTDHVFHLPDDPCF